MMLGSLTGMQVTVSINATESAGPHWPVKRRSKRQYKKLVKRLGPQFTEKPVAIKTPFGLIVHPEIYAEMQRQSFAEGEQK